MRRALVGVPVLALLALQVALFIATAWRGLDLTDESYYLLSYLHWRDVVATASFFGAYFELPFRALGGDAGAMRVFGLVLLMASGGLLTWRACAFGRDPDEAVQWPLIAAGVAGTLFYYSYATTLRAPSYNLLVLTCMLASTALLLVLTEGRAPRGRLAATAFGYGLLIGACALTKATSAAATVLCHLLFLGCFGRASRWTEWVVWGLTGVGVNVAVLHAVQPEWLAVAKNGVALTTALDGGHTTIRWATLWPALLRGAARLLPVLVLSALLFGVAVRRWGRSHRSVVSGMVVVLVAAIMLTIQRQGYGKSWWVLLAFGAAMLWIVERLCRSNALPNWRDVRGTAGLSMLLFALPICYSIGTNGSLPAHTQMAAVFSIVALTLPLRRLDALGLIHSGAYAASLALLSLPMLTQQLRSLEDPAFTYRLRTGLIEQRFPLTIGSRSVSLQLDALTREGLQTLARRMAEAGYRAGDPILDATGDGPGLVYALAGRPLGVPWIIGGYAGSERVAAQILDRVPEADLRRAWVLSADDNPRAVKGLPRLLRERTGAPGPQPIDSFEFVAQYRWDGLPPQPVIVTLWKPSAGATAGSQ